MVHFDSLQRDDVVKIAGARLADVKTRLHAQQVVRRDAVRALFFELTDADGSSLCAQIDLAWDEDVSTWLGKNGFDEKFGYDAGCCLVLRRAVTVGVCR